MKKLIGPHTPIRESDDLFLLHAMLHGKKPPFCLCAHAMQNRAMTLSNGFYSLFFTKMYLATIPTAFNIHVA